MLKEGEKSFVSKCKQNLELSYYFYKAHHNNKIWIEDSVFIQIPKIRLEIYSVTLLVSPKNRAPFWQNEKNHVKNCCIYNREIITL